MKDLLDRENNIFVATRVVNIPKRQTVFFFAKINDVDGYLAIYGETMTGFDSKTLFPGLRECRVSIGREEEVMTIIDVNHGQWLKEGESGIIEIEYEDKLISISFSPEKGTYNSIPFEKIIDIS
jgi:hypothetical protein